MMLYIFFLFLYSNNKKMILLLVLVSCVWANLLKMNTNIPAFRYTQAGVGIQYQTVQANQTLSIKFDQINYEISSELYLKWGQLTTSRYDKQNYPYNQSLQSSCYLYPTLLDIQTLKSAHLSSKPLCYHFDEQTLHIVTDDQKLYAYEYSGSSVTQTREFDIPDAVINRSDSMFFTGVCTMVRVKQHLYMFFSGDGYILNTTEENGQYFQPVTGLTTNTTHSSGVYHENRFWISGQTSIAVYQVNDYVPRKISYVFEYSNFTHKDIEFIKMQQSNISTEFFITTLNRFQILSIVQGQQSLRTYQVNGTCTHVEKIKEMVYLSCTYEHINYIMEVRVRRNDDTGDYTTSVNRYYDDGMVEGVMKVRPVGNNKMLLMGEDESLLLGEAVNRWVLLDLMREEREQRKDILFSMGLVDVFNLPEYASDSQSIILVLTESTIELKRIKQQPPELWCQFDGSTTSETVTALVTFNNTQCPGFHNETKSLDKMCETLFLFEIQIGALVLQKKKANISIFGIVILALIAVLLCLGWCCKFRKQTKMMINQIKEKIEELKKKQEQTQIKKL